MSPICSAGKLRLSVRYVTRSSPPNTLTISPCTNRSAISFESESCGSARTTPFVMSECKKSAALKHSGESKHASQLVLGAWCLVLGAWCLVLGVSRGHPSPTTPFTFPLSPFTLTTSPPAAPTPGRKPHGRFSMPNARWPRWSLAPAIVLSRKVRRSHQLANSLHVRGGASGSRPADFTRSFR